MLGIRIKDTSWTPWELLGASGSKNSATIREQPVARASNGQQSVAEKRGSFGRTWDSHGVLSGLLGLSWVVLGLSWGSLGCLGTVLGSLGAVLGHLGAVLGLSGSLVGLSWPLLGLSWAFLGLLGAVLDRFGPSWGCLGSLGAASGAKNLEQIIALGYSRVLGSWTGKTSIH
jgi:hypothetical protein